ncbi:hypothetical protein BC833DRAFT_568857 [Globomyces pollinis-pini]|nr:hypothetical protein BC833DRAFT_568857 [Globomyces pollinis-pini]
MTSITKRKERLPRHLYRNGVSMYEKRKNTILKKADELSILTGCQVLFLTSLHEEDMNAYCSHKFSNLLDNENPILKSTLDSMGLGDKSVILYPSMLPKDQYRSEKSDYKPRQGFQEYQVPKQYVNINLSRDNSSSTTTSDCSSMASDTESQTRQIPHKRITIRSLLTDQVSLASSCRQYRNYVAAGDLYVNGCLIGKRTNLFCRVVNSKGFVLISKVLFPT